MLLGAADVFLLLLLAGAGAACLRLCLLLLLLLLLSLAATRPPPAAAACLCYCCLLAAAVPANVPGAVFFSLLVLFRNERRFCLEVLCSAVCSVESCEWHIRG